MHYAITILSLAFIVGCSPKKTIHIPWEADQQIIRSALQMYYEFTGELPTTDQGLNSLMERPLSLPKDRPWNQIITKPIRDAWGNDYQYRFIGGKPPEFEIRSFGPDGIRSADDLTAQMAIDERRDNQYKAEQAAPSNR